MARRNPPNQPTDASNPAPTDYSHHDDAQLLADLRALPKLAKPHFAWPILPTATVPEYAAPPTRTAP